jgi:23S rRNA pseudouridine1911/1915/1917 synthase
LPFVLKKLIAPKKQKAFLFLMKELSYTQPEAQRLIACGRLMIDGEIVVKPTVEVEGAFEIIEFEPHSRGLEPHTVTEEFVLFEKPSGLLIHPLNRHTEYSLIDELKAQFGKDANIAHRIDQETSGLVLCGRNKVSERDLKMMFESRKIQKRYLALVHGKLEEELCIEEPLLRKNHESAIVRMVVTVDPSGKESKTFVKPLKYFANSDTTLVECSPYTGRQHQIRVHLFHVKHPIVGDPVYGQTSESIRKYLDRELSKDERIENSGATRLLLHANELEFELYGDAHHIKSKVDFEEVCRNHIRGRL